MLIIRQLDYICQKQRLWKMGEIVWKYSTKNWGMAFFHIDYLFKFIGMR